MLNKIIYNKINYKQFIHKKNSNYFLYRNRYKSNLCKNDSIKLIALHSLIRSFRQYGHLYADINPLNEERDFISLSNSFLHKDRFKLLFESSFTFSPEELEGMIHLKSLSTYLNNKKSITIPEIYDFLKKTYCHKMGIEFEHIYNEKERIWLANEIESISTNNNHYINPSEIRNAHIQIQKSEIFEKFLQKKFTSFKRYSGEGAEGMIPAIDTIFRTSAINNKNNKIIIGMPHRGRLALLVTLLNYPAHKLFNKINGNTDFPTTFHGIDDVTSHIGISTSKLYNGNKVEISLVSNPSHLEIINSVALGKVRATLDNHENAFGLLIHGDAAFSGQGCVPETFYLSNLNHFTVHGTIHMIVNNQIGFTTTKNNGRSSLYCSDPGKVINIPIIHVNGESIQDIIESCKIAYKYREKFKKDIIIDLVCYRRHGHNEVDEPSFTQPQMYNIIKKQKTLLNQLTSNLIQIGQLKPDKEIEHAKQIEEHLENEFLLSKNYQPKEIQAFQKKWKHMKQASGAMIYEKIDTGVDLKVMIDIIKQSIHLPEKFTVHDRLMRSHIEARKKMVFNDISELKLDIYIDWSTAEAIAFGTLLLDGYNIRLSGQDCIRGTFSHRHAGLTDQKTQEIYFPLSNLKNSKGTFTVINSNLSELAVLGFEYGYSWEDPTNLVLWEAQFGDFNNGAQIIIDQFIANGESKWMRQSGLVMLLPHGYDGAGPEHSSAKIERFLQLCDSKGIHPKILKSINDYYNDINLNILHLSTPANYFHALRRQQKRAFRKPLIIIGPKTLLREPEAVSSLKEMGPNSTFQPVIGDINITKKENSVNNIKKIIFCSGKIYYDLEKKRKESMINDYAIIRIEEICPFPYLEILNEFNTYINVKEIRWIQEEPVNQGSWSFLKPHMEKCIYHSNNNNIKKNSIIFIGRESLPTSAVGLSKRNNEQHMKIMEDAFNNII